MFVEGAFFASWFVEADAFVHAELVALLLSVGDEDDVDVSYGLSCCCGECLSLSYGFLFVVFVVDDAESVENSSDDSVGFEDGESGVREEVVHGDSSEVAEALLEVTREAHEVLDA